MGERENREAVVEFDRVALRFEAHIVLREVSFRLERGETKVLLGVTGTGKSVLLKMTMGLLQPDSGRIFVLGEEITNRSEPELFQIRHQIGMVFQEGALFDSLTVGENVGYVFQRLPEVSPEEVDRRVREALCFVELEHTLDLFPSQLSGGNAAASSYCTGHRGATGDHALRFAHGRVRSHHGPAHHGPCAQAAGREQGQLVAGHASNARCFSDGAILL